VTRGQGVEAKPWSFKAKATIFLSSRSNTVFWKIPFLLVTTWYDGQCGWILCWLQFAVECREDTPQSTWLEIPSHSCAPFWPVSTDTRKKMVARVKDSAQETLPFDITEPHTTLLQLQHDVCSSSCCCCSCICSCCCGGGGGRQTWLRRRCCLISLSLTLHYCNYSLT